MIGTTLRDAVTEVNAEPISFSVVKIKGYFNDLHISTSTGFFWHGFLDGKANLWLITNWHVVTGRNALRPNEVLHKHGSVPNKLVLDIPSLNPMSGGEREEGKLYLHEHTMPLYHEDGTANWVEHQARNAVDVVAISWGNSLADTLVRGMNELCTANDMAVNIGNDVFIIGYPLGFSHFAQTPIWKRGSIASEPHAETPESRYKLMLDATTRQGMSGSPVIMRAQTHYLNEKSEIVTLPLASRVIGIYSSRPDVTAVQNASMDESDRRPEIGYMFKSGCIEPLLRHGRLASDWGVMDWVDI